MMLKLLPLVFLLFGSAAFAASVKEVNTKKKIADVELDDGESFDKGAAVCFFDDGGEKVECGTVSKVKGSLVQVKVPKPKKLKVGMMMKKDDEAGSDDEKSGGDDEDKKSAVKKKKPPKANPFRMVGQYSPGLRTPAAFNKLAYKCPETSAPETLWSVDSPVNIATLGAGVEADIPLGKLALNPGVRYRLYTPSLIDSDFTCGRLNPYVSTEESASALGIYLDVQYLRINVNQLIGINLTAGLDVDMSTVELKSTKKDDSAAGTKTELAKATSKLDVISLRLGASTDILALKIIGARLGLNVLVPLVGVGATFSGKLADDAGRGVTSDPGKDLQKALGHKKASFAAEVALGGVLAL